SMRLVFHMFILCLLLPHGGRADVKCPGGDSPPTPVLKANLNQLTSALENLVDLKGRKIWETTEESKEALRAIFDQEKTKLEQFYQLLFLLQKDIPENYLPVVVLPPRITDVLLESKVFTKSDFPRSITAVHLRKGAYNPVWEVHFSKTEVRFPLNNGKGFATWDQGMCQTVKELVFYPGFSFKIRRARNSKNLVVDGFDKVELYGTFGSRGLFKIDLNYVDLEKVEFIRGTDQGKVTAKVAKREFLENPHSALFKFIGSLIPNTARQRIDW
ncbi:MAG: hypothetical protein Q7S00_02420, partial [bacterium]|nr:hypothetical protein [bacterium]